MNFKTIILSVLMLCMGAMAPVWANQPEAASDWVVNQAGSVRVVSAQAGTLERNEILAGLEFKMNPGWKIYWRTPGDAGFPPSFLWDGSSNITGLDVTWPAPTRFELLGLQNYGYADHVILPLHIKLAAPSADTTLALALDYLICEKICVPVTANVSLNLAGNSNATTAQAHDIAKFQGQIPRPLEALGVSVLRLEQFSGDNGFVRVELAGRAWQRPDVFIEPDSAASFDAPKYSINDDRLLVEISIAPAGLKDGLEQALHLTITDQDFAGEITQTPVPATNTAREVQSQPNQIDSIGLIAMLATALLGGLILNVMPCVLPVLGIKIMGVVSQAGQHRTHVRFAFLAAALGIITSFLVLAAAAIALKAGGHAVGWGIQFQQPWFLIALIILLLGFAANLFGLFEINLPGGIASKLPTGKHHSLRAHFLSGAFATLLATPCSAPFLGTAIGFALSRGWFEIWAIFTALGIGMALPFLALAIFPGWASRLPKPGNWMNTVRRLLGLALLGTAIWLGSVLWVQTQVSDTESAQANANWVAFDQNGIDGLVKSGRVVFVDVTADWCITCKVNKAAVLDRAHMVQAFELANVVAMRADWTKPDPQIAAYLEKFGRFGIPFNVVYGPKAPQGIALPEFLTQAIVLDALRAAGAAGL